MASVRPPGCPTPQAEARDAQQHIEKIYRANANPSTAIIDTILTVFIAAFTAILSLTVWLQVSTARASERAYVKMSHEPPGVEFRGRTAWGMQIRITNHGRTPAKITDIHAIGLYLRPKEPLPDEPDYQRQRGRHIPMHAFLVTNENFWFPIGDTTSQQRMSHIRNGKINFYVIGYMDYTDKFGTKHRAGYARRYIPDLDERPPNATNEQYAKRNNLTFITKLGYNYDRVRRSDDEVFQESEGD